MINHFFLESVLSFLTPGYSTCFASLAILCLLFLHYSLNVQILRVVLLVPFAFYILHHSFLVISLLCMDLSIFPLLITSNLYHEH